LRFEPLLFHCEVSFALTFGEGNYVVESLSARSARQHKAWGVSPRIQRAKVSSPRSGRQPFANYSDV